MLGLGGLGLVRIGNAGMDLQKLSLIVDGNLLGVAEHHHGFADILIIEGVILAVEAYVTVLADLAFMELLDLISYSGRGPLCQDRCRIRK
jgi:hypothetical protein